MGGVFSKPKPPKPTPTQPAPTTQQADMAGEEEIKKQRRKSGFESTFLTGSLVPKTGKKTVLG